MKHSVASAFYLSLCWHVSSVTGGQIEMKAAKHIGLLNANILITALKIMLRIDNDEATLTQSYGLCTLVAIMC